VLVQQSGARLAGIAARWAECGGRGELGGRAELDVRAASGRASVGVEHNRRCAAFRQSRLSLSLADDTGHFLATALVTSMMTVPCPSGEARLVNRGVLERPGWLSAIWSQARGGS
jgi:hypothetical protein